MARGKDVFGIMPTRFGKSLIFQIFPRLASRLPLISIMRDQVEQLKKLGFSAALSYLASVKRERRTRRKREKETAKLFSVIRGPG